MTDFKEGDKVRVVFEGVWSERGVSVEEHWMLHRDGPLKDAESIELIELAGRPLEVGEVVLYGVVPVTVRSTWRNSAWVWGEDDPSGVVCKIHNLRRRDDVKITEAKS